MELISGCFGVVKACEERCNTGIIFAPEVVGDCCGVSLHAWNHDMADTLQDRVTVGPSEPATVGGMLRPNECLFRL